jgi:translation initiation factor 2B subunit (eIF-2B alpha/beta/delta family)
MPTNLDGVVRRVLEDRASGASEVALYVLRDLIAILSDQRSAPSRRELRDFALGLHKARQAMAPLFWVSNAILDAMEGSEAPDLAVLRRELEAMSGSLEREAGILNENALQVLKRRRVLTNSHSGTIAAAILHASRSGKVTAVVTESLPGGEGRIMAQNLADQGIEVELVPDSMAATMMIGCDGAVVGADSVGRAGVTNKVGTLGIALVAKAQGKPVHVVAGVSKLSPLPPGDLMREERRRDHLIERGQAFEVVPLEMFSGFVTDKGLLYADEIVRLIAERRLARAWSDIDTAGK